MTKKIDNIELGDFQLKVSPFPHTPPPISRFVIEILCSLEDGDSYKDDKLTWDMPAKTAEDSVALLEKVLEIEMVKNQFPNGKSTLSECFNQINYFRPDLYKGSSYSASSEEGEQYILKDKHWDWVEDLPYSYDSEATYDIYKYNVYYYDEVGAKNIVNLSLPSRFLEVLNAVNTDAGIHQYQMDREDWDKQGFINYREKVAALLEKEMLNIKVAKQLPKLDTLESALGADNTNNINTTSATTPAVRRHKL